MKALKVSNEPYPKVRNNTDDLLINRAIFSLEGLPTKASGFKRGLPTRAFFSKNDCQLKLFPSEKIAN